MKITKTEIRIGDLFKGFRDIEEEGVFGWDGKLNIRPIYQREFIYKDDQRNAVINTIRKGFPLNIMYWGKNENGTYELMDGQQRTISICNYLDSKYSIDYIYWHNLKPEQKQEILDYLITVYICEGTESEKLDWFKIINIAGEELTPQELRNAVYTGIWLTSAKKYFSKTGCFAFNIARDYLGGTAIRQEYLETVLDWISDGNIEEYMASNQKKENADDLKEYFEKVINWVKLTFPIYRKPMKGLPWGKFYNKYKDITFNSQDLEDRIKDLMKDEEVTNKKGIYEYVLSENSKTLNIRSFTENQKIEAFERQMGKCVKCTETFTISQMEADHITPWSLGGKTNSDNCQMLCKRCNRTKSDK